MSRPSKLYKLREDLQNSLKAVDSQIKELEDSVLAEMLQNNETEKDFGDIKFRVKVEEKKSYKIIEENLAFPKIDSLCPGIVKKSVHHQSLQKFVKDYGVVPGIKEFNKVTRKLDVIRPEETNN